jgi:type II secretory pathway component GspD/PulD (secretin)
VLTQRRSAARVADRPIPEVQGAEMPSEKRPFAACGKLCYHERLFSRTQIGSRSKTVKTQAVVLAVILVLSGGASAQNSETSQSVSSQSASEARGISLPALLAELGGRLHKNFVLDPRAASDKIDLLSLRQQDITFPQLLSILGVYGLVIISDGTTAQVIPNTDVRWAALPLLPPDNLKTLDDEPVATVLAVKGISAAQLVPILRPMIPTWGHLAAFPDRNALIIVDRTSNVKRLLEMIRILEALPKAAQPEQPKSP